MPLVDLRVPAAPAVPPRPSIPIVGSLAPVLMSGVLFAVTGSVFALVFAALGPVTAVAGFADGAWTRRRTARRESRRHTDDLARLTTRIGELHDAERARLTELADLPASPRWDDPTGAIEVPLGLGRIAGIVRLVGDDRPDDPELDAVRAAAAAIAGAPVLADARLGVGIAGPPVLARAVARRIALHVLARCSPATTSVSGPASEGWMRALPHEFLDDGTPGGGTGAFRVVSAGEEVAIVGWAGDAASLPARARIRAEARPGAPDDTRVLALSSAAALQLARAWAARADQRGMRPPRLPARVPLGELLAAAPAGRPGLAAPLGADDRGPVLVDLVADGPHALVAGTTGSGKSELLVAWVLGMAAARSPDDVGFVLVDFKGGAAFAPLAGLPHVLGVVSDLDGRLARRAIDSLRAELRRRERTLADRGARSIDELAAGVLPRLVVVVDEFAAVVAEHPDLHALFADVAARGRSLGMHLVLCTQRPAGVVRDGVLANVTLRMSLRVADRGDSRAVLGTDDAAALPLEPPGRAVLAPGDGRTRMLQVALASPADAARIAQTAPAARHPAPWLPPLPERLALDALPPAAPGAAVFGLLDRPLEQSQPAAVWRADDDGGLLVLGGRGSGRSVALATLAAGCGARLLPADPPGLWRAVDAVRPGDGVLAIDDVDVVLADADPDTRAALVARLERAARRPGVTLLAAARHPDGVLRGLERAFPARLLLAQPSREDHALAGGETGTWAPRLPPGAGWWRGDPVQVAIGAAPAAGYPVPPLRRVRLGERLAIAAGRPRELATALSASGARVVPVGGAPGDDDALRVGRGEPPTVLLGDPDAWNADWAALAEVRRAGLLLLDVDATDARALGRVRETPPLGPGEGWWVEGGVAERVVLDLGGQASAWTSGADARP